LGFSKNDYYKKTTATVTGNRRMSRTVYLGHWQLIQRALQSRVYTWH